MITLNEGTKTQITGDLSLDDSIYDLKLWEINHQVRFIQTTELEGYVNQLADRLEEDHKEYNIKHYNKNLSIFGATRSFGKGAKKHLDEIENGSWQPHTKFVVTKGRKYFRITEYKKGSSYCRGENEYRLADVNCFVDIKTGDVYKSLSYSSKAPYTKYAKYNLLDADSREECLSKADWMGGHLYLEENSDYEKYWLTEELTKKYIG